MQSRKKRNLEIERKKKQQKMFHLGVLAAIALVAVIVIGWVVWDTQNRRFIMTFQGERIATGDFRLMGVMNQQPINDFTRHSLLNELLAYLIIMDMGNRYGVGFTPEEIQANTIEASDIRSWIEGGAPGSLGFISDRRLGEFMHAFEQIGRRLIDLLVEYIPDEDELREITDEHIERLIEDSTEIYVKFVAATFWDDFTDVALELVADEGFDFDDIIERHCVIGEGIEPISMFDFIVEYGAWDADWDFIRTLAVGDFTFVIPGNEFQFILYIYDRILPEFDLDELDEIKAELRENFILSRSMDIFFDMLDEWVSQAEFELNHRVFDTIS